uniref:Conidiation-specific protein 6 n=1 Tax=Schizophyllum commune (strain H4-8 / FGSC 9210) TaxID=578458 RepID=D8PP52_SCHCM
MYAENNTHKNPERVAAGYKGTLNNPNAGQEAKENASQRLREHGEDQPRASIGRSSSGLGRLSRSLYQSHNTYHVRSRRYRLGRRVRPGPRRGAHRPW